MSQGRMPLLIPQAPVAAAAALGCLAHLATVPIALATECEAHVGAVVMGVVEGLDAVSVGGVSDPAPVPGLGEGPGLYPRHTTPACSTSICGWVPASSTSWWPWGGCRMVPAPSASVYSWAGVYVHG